MTEQLVCFWSQLQVATLLLGTEVYDTSVLVYKKINNVKEYPVWEFFQDFGSSMDVPNSDGTDECRDYISYLIGVTKKCCWVERHCA